MTNKEILTKAIQKAIDGKWDKFGKKTADWRVLDNEADNTFPGYEIKFMDKKHHWFCTSNDVIFSHDFAKALWGEELFDHSPDSPDFDIVYDYVDNSLWHSDGDYWFMGYKWQYHLQQMVIAAAPIKYLGENI